MSEGKPTISSDPNQTGEGTITQRSNEDPLSDGTAGASAAAPNAASHDAAWDRVASRMRQDIGEAAWRNWIKPLRVSRLEDGTLTLEANSTLARERVTSQYADRLRVISAAEFGGVKKVEVRVAAQSAPRMSQQKPAPAKPGAKALGAGLDPRYTFANFVVGKPNELAFAVARRTAESATVAFNPLFLYGGVGLGKTHLMHAIAWHIREQDPSRNVVYLSAEKFMYRFVQALRYRDTMSFKEQFRSVDVLMIDDVQFISGKDSTQEEFFHTFNALVEDGRQVIISADKSPTDLEGMEERLRSRLGWGMVADIHPADYELRLGILQSKAERARVAVPTRCWNSGAPHFQQRAGAGRRADPYRRACQPRRTRDHHDSAAELLSDLLRASSRQISIDEIQKQVAAHYDVRVTEMFPAPRPQHCAPAPGGHVSGKDTDLAFLPEIGRRLVAGTTRR